MRPIKIISGGQTGADQGALVAAKQMGIPTGGWMPRGFMTEAGPCPVLRDLYNVQEHPSPQYPRRTRQNVKDADGTIWVGGPADSRGMRCTQRACDDLEKPFLMVTDPKELVDWMGYYKIRTLNVSGPRASHDRYAHQRAAELLIAAFGNLDLLPGPAEAITHKTP